MPRLRRQLLEPVNQKASDSQFGWFVFDWLGCGCQYRARVLSQMPVPMNLQVRFAQSFYLVHLSLFDSSRLPVFILSIALTVEEF